METLISVVAIVAFLWLMTRLIRLPMEVQPWARWWRAWRRCRTLSDQGACVVDWLEGRHSRTPTYCGGPDPETAELIPRLVEINLAGLVTHNSQPGAVGSWRQCAYLNAYGPPPLVRAVAVAAVGAGLSVDTDLPEGPRTEKPPRRPWRDRLRTPRTKRDEAVAVLWPRDQVFPTTRWFRRDMRKALDRAAHICIVDPRPGRKDLLWDVVALACRSGAQRPQGGRITQVSRLTSELASPLTSEDPDD